ncbi:unnamed protein product [Toxocara canis]|uniref:Ephrin RBD domain-containing protein n=1 Tax=Toxocara canis TaxID=6265 RepID=A0A183UHZ2_TOXCA|nr:unnamed protein product [Toxocara canis]
MDVNIMDSLAIHCPLFDETIPYNDTEMLLIYRVSQLEYEHCIADEIARIVGRCSRPYIPQTIHTVFRHFTPLPSGLEYTPGNTYYFVSEPDLRLRGSQKEKHAHCSTVGPQMRIRVHQGTTEVSVILRMSTSITILFEILDFPHKMRHHSGVHHHFRPDPMNARHRHEAADGLRQPAAIRLNEMLMEDAPSENEFSATQTEEGTHLRSTQLPSRRRDEAKIHQEEPKLYEVHEIDGMNHAYYF